MVGPIGVTNIYLLPLSFQTKICPTALIVAFTSLPSTPMLLLYINLKPTKLKYTEYIQYDQIYSLSRTREYHKISDHKADALQGPTVLNTVVLPKVRYLTTQ